MEGDETGFEGVFEEDTFFTFGPGDVVSEGVDLDLLAVWDGVEEVEEGADCVRVERSVLTVNKCEKGRTY